MGRSSARSAPVGLRVRHARSGRTVTLAAGYVQTAVGLGYASTVHAAQGVTTDTMHGVVIGEESRQQLYTMLTRTGFPWSPLRRETHGGFGERSGETDPEQSGHRAPGRLISNISSNRVVSRVRSPSSRIR